MILRAFSLFGVLLLVAGIAMLLFADSTLAATILIVIGLLVGAIGGGISVARSTYRSAREWANLARGGGPSSVKVVSVEPPKGVIFNRDAVFTLEVTGADGASKRLEREMPVPIPQAFMWRLVGRVPTPIGRLTEARELNVEVWRRKNGSPPAA